MNKVKCALAAATISMAFATTAHASPVQQCIASWYGPGFHGKLMANSKPFDQNNPTHLAHKSLPFGTEVEIVNESNGRSLRAIVTDRGPYVHGRCVDVSRAGAIQLGFFECGYCSSACTGNQLILP